MINIGHWSSDKAGLPCFEYTGGIPYSARLDNGTEVKLPEDPWFLLGNYRFTLFTHISGEYELISGERSWARINQGKKKNSGVNLSEITVDGEKFTLTGMDSLAANSQKCRRVFGCGFANYSYEINRVSVNRNLSVKPSTETYNGASAFLMTVTVKNNGGKSVNCTYSEFVGANFETIQFQTMPKEWFPLKYANEYSENAEDNSARVVITAHSDDPLIVPDREAMSKHDAFPPLLFMKSLSENTVFSGGSNGICAKLSFTLAPNEEKTFGIIIGYSFEYGSSTQNGICAELSTVKTVTEPVCAFAEEWLKIIPAFENEKDETLRRELRWHVYNLEAMATYSEYYNETKIPQGTIYDYHWGQHASARDNFQHALPLVYYNPKLAKSVLRYLLKRTTSFGEIRLIEYGNGYADNDRYFTSDQQLYFFLLLSEYLRVTKDHAFMGEKVQPYPAKKQTEMTVAELTEKCFIFLRDTIGTGVHGLVKLLNSDWNDAVYYIEKVPYNNIFFTGESHMNSAMVISIFQTLIPELKSAAEYSERLDRLCESMTLYRNNILRAYLADMSERSFPRRMYFNGKPYGDDNMFLEPQGFTLQINELSEERKRLLYEELKKRVYSGEKLGAREQEAPEFDDDGFDKGSRENGGFWWALNGPVIIGVSQFDKQEAVRLLKNMTLQHLSEEFPQYWSSYWSAADNLESSLIPEEGLPDQTIDYAAIPVYCAHPHAWILYCYYRINE